MILSLSIISLARVPYIFSFPFKWLPCRIHWPRRPGKTPYRDKARPVTHSLRSKRFRLVSEQRKTEEGDFRFWPREKWHESQKVKEGGGGGEGRKRLQTNPSILKTCVRQRTQRLIGSASGTMLTCLDQRLFHTERSCLVRDTHINFLWLLFILVGKIFPPVQEHFI